MCVYTDRDSSQNAHNSVRGRMTILPQFSFSDAEQWEKVSLGDGAGHIVGVTISVIRQRLLPFED